MRRLSASLLVLPFLAAPVEAGIIAWEEPMNGFFSDGEKWEGGVAPGVNDTARYEEPGSYSVTFQSDQTVDQIAITDGSVRLNIAGFTHAVEDPSDVAVRVGFLSTETASLLIRGGELRTPGATAGFLLGAQGTFDVSGSSSLLSVTNRFVIGDSGEGTLEISSGGVVDFGPELDVGVTPGSVGLIDIVDSTSILQGSGTLTLGQGTTSGSATLKMTNDPVVTASKILVRPSGVITGLGSLNAEVENQGRVEPGADFGDIQIDGDYTQTQTGALRVRIGGDVTTRSSLVSTGAVTLAGTIEVAPIGSFLGQPGDEFVIIEGASVSGIFDTETVTPFENDLSVIVRYLPDRVLLRVIDPDNRADLTGDGFVNAADLSIILGTWGSDDPLADLDGNGVVGPPDLSILISNWLSL